MTEMTIRQLKEFIHNNMLKSSEIFLMDPPDPLATDSDIDKVVDAIGFDLPKLYRDFLIEFGGGSFGFVDIYSVYEFGTHYILKILDLERIFIKNGILPVSDDYCGGVYCIKLREINDEYIYYSDEEGNLIKTNFYNIYKFVAAHSF